MHGVISVHWLANVVPCMDIKLNAVYFMRLKHCDSAEGLHMCLD